MTKYVVLGSLFLSAAALANPAAPASGDPLEGAAIEQARGQAPDAVQIGAFLKGSGEKTDFQVLLEGNKCYWFSGTSDNLSKLYMYLWAPNAKFFTPRLTDAKTTAGKVTMAHCAKESGMYRFQVKSEGPGRYVVGVFGKDAPPQVAPPPPAVAQVQAAPDLGPLCDKTAGVAAPGSMRQGDFFEGKGSSIGHDDRVDYSIQMDAGRCYWIIGCAEPEKVKALYLYLWGPDNKRITEAKSDTPNPMVGHCARETGMFKAQAKMASGKGYYKVGVYVR